MKAKNNTTIGIILGGSLLLQSCNLSTEEVVKKATVPSSLPNSFCEETKIPVLDKIDKEWRKIKEVKKEVQELHHRVARANEVEISPDIIRKINRYFFTQTQKGSRVSMDKEIWGELFGEFFYEIKERKFLKESLGYSIKKMSIVKNDNFGPAISYLVFEAKKERDRKVDDFNFKQRIIFSLESKPHEKRSYKIGNFVTSHYHYKQKERSEFEEERFKVVNNFQNNVSEEGSLGGGPSAGNTPYKIKLTMK